MSYEELCEILVSDNVYQLLKENEDKIFELIPELKMSYKFDQCTKWHVYDVWEHTLHVVEGVDNDLVLRITALFHDAGKPYKFIKDENGTGHFYGHWEVSQEIFLKYADIFSIDNIELISKLIYYHDLKDNIPVEDFSVDELEMLFKIKRSDLLAQNPIYSYQIEDINKLEEFYINRIKSR